MLGNLLAAALLVLTTSVQPQIRGTVNEPIPVEYQGNTKVNVEFYSPYEVEYYCLDGKFNEDYIIYACYKEHKKEGKDRLIMPNPCLYPEADIAGSYAHLICHEMAHKNGWRH